LTQSDLPSASSTVRPGVSLFSRIAWGALIITTLSICYFSHLGALGFVGPDEPRYAWVARAMAESGDWVTPRLYGKPWFEKPVLYYWEAALSFKTFGVSEAAARLPSAISALLATLALAWLALRVYGASTARWFLLLLPTTVAMIGFSHAAAMDMPFSAMLAIALVCAAAALGLARNEKTPVLRKTPWLALVFFGLFLGLAVLAKGPAGIILCGGAVLVWAFFTKRWRDAFRLLHPVAIASFCATAFPWYILCALRNPGFFHAFIIEQNFARYLTPEYHHIQPFWFYGPILLLAIVPWIVPLLAFARDVSRTWRDNLFRMDPCALFLGCWCAFTLLFFSASQSKLPGYILPAIPPFVLLMVNSVARRLGPPGKKIRWIGVGSGLTLIALAVGLELSLKHIPFAVDYQPPHPVNAVLLTLALAGIAITILGLWGRSSLALAACVLVLVSCLAWSLTGDARWSLDEGITAGLTGTSPQEVVRRFGVKPAYIYKLNRSFRYSLDFHFERELPDWSPEDNEEAWVFTSPAESRKLSSLGLRCPVYVVAPAVVVCESFASAARRASGGKVR
jgi:4-amino-4-deoxy-L-arabinose transferase-like glycosyltransferase